MGKILLIEPQKILRQAIGLSLFPDHEVKVEEEIAKDVGSSKDYDLLIIDGAALRESNRLTPEAIRVIQSCKTPTLWLEEDPASHTIKRDKLVVVQKPVERETFQAALAGLLSSSGLSRERSGLIVADTFKGSAKKKRSEATQQPGFQFIDLVDVVEEQPPPKQRKKAPRKSK